MNRSRTFLALCQDLRKDIGIAGVGPATVVGQSGILEKLVGWIAAADMAVQSLHFDWDFLWDQHSAATQAGLVDMSAPSDIGRWDNESFYLDYTTANHVKLSVMDYRYWRRALRQGVKVNAQPSFVVILPNRSLKLEPPPDKVYTLTADYWKHPTRMSANTDTSPIPEKYDRIIIAQAKQYYADHDDAPEIMRDAQREYADLLNTLRADFLPGQEANRMADNDLTMRPE